MAKNATNTGDTFEKAIDNSQHAKSQGSAGKSLVAFLRAIKFHKPHTRTGHVDRYFAQLQPQARQRRALAEENYWVRSAN
jgi:hypothetical protein